MISDSASPGFGADAWDRLRTLLRSEGSVTHPHVRALLNDAAPRDLSDAVHAICAIHGNASERFHEAAGRADDGAHRDWIERLADGFAGERSYLATIVSAAGPTPSTPGQAQTEQAFATERHTFHMLALSDRWGCMIGAAAALVLEWQAIRTLLDLAAARFGAEVREDTLPDRHAIEGMVEDASQSAAAARAIGFGAQQVLAQHRALWDLLEARAGARTPQ